MTDMYYGGIEGGATHSKLIICNQNGDIIATGSGPSTNHWMVGIPECAKRIAKMVEAGKSEGKIPQNVKLKTLGLSLSGCEQEASNKAIEKELLDNYPEVSEKYVVCSDTMGSVVTASPKGGLVLIAGTGSNALLSNPDGKIYSCGGWGNFLADEASAWWISHKAVKTVFDHVDGLNVSPYPIDTVWELIKLHFSVSTRADLLEYCYAKFQKSMFAGLCLRLSYSANDGDQLSQHLFREAGIQLAKATLALIPKVCPTLVKAGDLNIVCVGSVWKSWNLLKEGFLAEIGKGDFNFGLTLLRLNQSMALGAVYLGVDANNYNMPRDYAKNYEVFHCYHNKTVNNNNSNHD
ncbi:N-acetyl-D-glucosamine kinase isoform X1 [Bradysia coprophila]|uniref:N-acetyl-D-glucosamine kinase isoform X1 n=2 Tax=Bradysia coprophila TaxID=38358 RepID=UPI00187DD7A8|nr:N-acetyl-D-glucosamine kinase isoform X1 [Bradysia coprophila]XP_037029303.1 N-acetyl-D-glucosamine kinase isoform X1 [Bradysia coprophila]